MSDLQESFIRNLYTNLMMLPYPTHVDVGLIVDVPHGFETQAANIIVNHPQLRSLIIQKRVVPILMVEPLPSEPLVTTQALVMLSLIRNYARLTSSEFKAIQLSSEEMMKQPTHQLGTFLYDSLKDILSIDEISFFINHPDNHRI